MLVVKNLPASAGDTGDVGLGRSTGRGNGYPFQYSCLENSMDRGAWQATVHEDTKESNRTEQLTQEWKKERSRVTPKVLGLNS